MADLLTSVGVNNSEAEETHADIALEISQKYSASENERIVQDEVEGREEEEDERQANTGQERVENKQERTGPAPRGGRSVLSLCLPCCSLL